MTTVAEPASRADRARAFLDRAGWGAAARAPLAGDASDRRYERLERGRGRAVLMDAPPGRAEGTGAFVAMARHLAALGLSPPRILAEDRAAGFLLLEDLGDGLFPRRIAADPASEPRLYAAATDVLAHLQRAPRPPGLPDLAARDWAEAAAGLVLDHYAPEAAALRHDLTGALADLIARHADGPRVLILRDYHAENLLWLPRRTGLARVGLLDFQAGQGGQPAYDLVSLVQDARRDVPEPVARAATRRFAAATGAAGADLAAAVAVLGAQRALRILGVFARLCVVAGKARYLALMPRVWGHLQANLAHPALSPLARVCGALPAPDPARRAALEARCPAR